jgi:hypothetical protein
MENSTSFKSFLDKVSPFLEHYELVFRISRDEKIDTLIITPVPKNEKTRSFSPIRITGTIEELASIMDDPTEGMIHLSDQIGSLDLTELESVKKTRKKRIPRSDDPEEPIADIPKDEPAIDKDKESEEKEEPANQSIAPNEPPSPIQGLPVSGGSEPPAEKTPVFESNSSDAFEEYRKLSQNITLEIRGLAPDWKDVEKMWKRLMEVYRGMDKKSQEDFKDRCRSLHQSIIARQDKDKALIEETK